MINCLARYGSWLIVELEVFCSIRSERPPHVRMLYGQKAEGVPDLNP